MRLGVSLCNYERFVGGNVERERRRVDEVADALCQVAKQGLIDEVLVFDFNGHPEKGDASVGSCLVSLLSRAVRTRHVGYAADPMHAMEEIGQVDAMVAMRMHAAVFAYCQERPTLLIAYHEKCHAWAAMIGMDRRLVIDTSNLSRASLAAAIQGMVTHEYESPRLAVADAMDASRRNWNWPQRERPLARQPSHPH